MQLSIPHKYTQIEAITRVKKALNQSRSQLAAHLTDVKEEWKGSVLHYAFTVQKHHIEGTLEVKDRSFEIYAKLPLMLRMFEGRIEKAAKEEIAKLVR